MIRSRAIVLFVCSLAFGTPALGATLSVNAGGSLQAAIDAAQPGDTIVLQAGATFTGQFILRAKGGSAYITIRSSTADASLPGAGTRITPAHAPLLAKLRPGISGSAIRTEPGASYWRLQFLEFLPSSSTSGSVLVEFGLTGPSQASLSQVPHHLVMDRCYVHGNPTYGYRRGLALNSGQAEIVNSHFSDFKGIGLETQAILGWNGPGPFLIENNYLEAAAENIMFGGADPSIASLVPSNIIIRRNLISKPVAWRTQSWPLKNLLELKNAQNVLIEGNLFENNWHAGQQGYAIVLTPRNQNGTAPWSVVRNITVRNNVIRHVAGGFTITGYDNNYPSQQTENITISNNLAYDISTAHTVNGTPAPGRFMVIGAGPRNVSIDHNTVDNNGSGTMLITAGYAPTGYRIYGFELTNNLLRANTYGIFGDAVGAGTTAFNYYTPNAIVLRNTFAGAAAANYPTGNYFPTLARWLADFVNLSGRDYRLTSTSLSNNAATDGTDIGENFTELNAALSGGTSAPPPPPPSTAPTAYSGTPITLPGTIQAEHYDRGGEGVAYHDTTAGNEGGVLRSDGVDLQTAEDTGGGYKVKNAVAGEWLRYAVNVPNAGIYTLTVRVASAGAGGAFHIEVGGVNKTGTMTVPNTGSWQSWQTLTRTGVQLAAGLQTVRLVMDSNGASGLTGNFNWMAMTGATATATSTPYFGTAVAMPGTVQAENYDRGGPGVAYHDTTSGNSSGLYRGDHVDLQFATDTGGGYKTKDAVAGEWLKYSVNVRAAGTYSINVRVASLGNGGTFHIEVNGVDRTGPLTVPNTGGWQTWRTVTRTGVALSSGPQVIRLVLDSNGSSGLTGNFNWIAVQ